MMNGLEASPTPGSARPLSLVLERRAYGAALEALSEELLPLAENYAGVRLFTPAFDQHSKTGVKLLGEKAMTPDNAQSLSGTSKQGLLTSLRQNVPTLVENIEGLAFRGIRVSPYDLGVCTLSLVELREQGDELKDAGELVEEEAEQDETAAPQGVLVAEQEGSWETLQAQANILNARYGRPAHILDRDLNIIPDLRVIAIASTAPLSLVDKAKAIIVGHLPLTPELKNAIPKPYSGS